MPVHNRISAVGDLKTYAFQSQLVSFFTGRSNRRPAISDPDRLFTNCGMALIQQAVQFSDHLVHRVEDITLQLNYHQQPTRKPNTSTE